MIQPSPTRAHDRQCAEANANPEKRTFQRRAPVNAAEIKFMRQRLEAEPVTTATESTITWLLELERVYTAGERRG